MEWANIFEALMLVTFGASWPAQIIKTVRVKNPMGKSFLFQILVISGYLCGVVSKCFKGQFMHWLTWIYLLDIALVTTDLVLSLIYRARIIRAQKSASGASA